MSPLKNSVIAALTSVGLTLGYLFYFQRERVRETERLRRENEILRVQASQRSSVGVPPAPLKPQAVPVKTAAENSAPVPSAPRLMENYRNEGRATPLAALQTFAWACDRGDTATVEKLLYFEGAAREKFARFMEATLPAEVRAKWKTTDEMAATLLTRAVMERPFPNADILDAATFEEINGDRTMYRLPGTSKDRIQFQKLSEGWSYVITEEMVEAYVVQSKAAR